MTRPYTHIITVIFVGLVVLFPGCSNRKSTSEIKETVQETSPTPAFFSQPNGGNPTDPAKVTSDVAIVAERKSPPVTLIFGGGFGKTREVEVSNESEVSMIRTFVSSHIEQHTDTNVPSPPRFIIRVVMEDEEIEVSYMDESNFFYANGRNGYLTAKQESVLESIITKYFE